MPGDGVNRSVLPQDVARSPRVNERIGNKYLSCIGVLARESLTNMEGSLETAGRLGKGICEQRMDEPPRWNERTLGRVTKVLGESAHTERGGLSVRTAGLRDTRGLSRDR